MLSAYKLPGYNYYPRFVKRLLNNPWKRDVHFLYQRLTRGWDDSETWSLEHSLAKHILPRLRRFREITIATTVDQEAQEWRDKLDKMIAAFEFVSSEDYWNATGQDYEKHQEETNSKAAIILSSLSRHSWAS